jgi:hypothetical protein
MGTFARSYYVIGRYPRPRRLLSGGSEGLGIWFDSCCGIINFPAGFKPTTSPQRLGYFSHFRLGIIPYCPVRSLLYNFDMWENLFTLVYCRQLYFIIHKQEEGCWSLVWNCFACSIASSSPKSDSDLQNQPFSHRNTKKSDSPVHVPGKWVAMSPQKPLRSWKPLLPNALHAPPNEESPLPPLKKGVNYQLECLVCLVLHDRLIMHHLKRNGPTGE